MNIGKDNWSIVITYNKDQELSCSLLQEVKINNALSIYINYTHLKMSYTVNFISCLSAATLHPVKSEDNS